MALTDYSDYQIKIASPSQVYNITKNSLATVAGRWSSLWVTAPFADVAPTTAAAPTRTTTGAIGQINGSGELRVGEVTIAGAQGATWILCDRLSHQGGLAGNTTATQTTNLGTAALTRYTDGVGVFGALEIYSAVGTTASTFTVRYTNQAGTAGQTSIANAIGTTTYNTAGRLLPILPAAGDYGIRAVASVTLGVTTGTAGNFGVTLFKPLLVVGCPQGGQPINWEPLLARGANMPEIVDDACLFWIVMTQTTSTGIAQIVLKLFES